MISVYPHCFYVWYLWTDLDDFLSYFLINTYVGVPIISNKSAIVFQINKVVHLGFDQTFVVNEEILNFL